MTYLTSRRRREVEAAAHEGRAADIDGHDGEAKEAGFEDR